jgi:hypothetical protein
MNKKSALTTLIIATLICVHVAEAQIKKIPRVGWLSVGYGPLNLHLAIACQQSIPYSDMCEMVGLSPTDQTYL